VQRPRPPLLVGGNSRALLTLAAREADIVGFTGLRATPDGRTVVPSGFPGSAVEERVALVRRTAGPRWPELELHALVQAVVITDDREAAADRLHMRLPELTRSEILDSPHLLLGSVAQICEQVLACRERFGFSYWSVFEGAMEAMSPVIDRLRSR
jgi:alkanesulfonate monooxygenase SsuD/methylene tetrahydromethanopterin reductase-like flavin-dependent oxidoreductase (luciferase family)